MTGPLFQPPNFDQPEQQKPADKDRKNVRRFGLGYNYTQQEAAGRKAFLTKIDRLCSAFADSDRPCIAQRANREFILFELDSDGNRTSENPIRKLSCGRHRAIFLGGVETGKYELVSETKLPPVEQ